MGFTQLISLIQLEQPSYIENVFDLITTDYIHIYIMKNSFWNPCRLTWINMASDWLEAVHLPANQRQTVKIIINYHGFLHARPYRAMRNRYSRLLFTSEDRLCAF